MPSSLRIFRRESNDLVIVVLRFAVGAVFLWFGIDKWIHPEVWYGWIPLWLAAILPMSLNAFLWLTGAFEFALGAALVAGRFLRPAAAVAALFLVSITLFHGANEATIRDNVIVGACLALFVSENAKAKNPLPSQTVSFICSLYLLFLFITGVLFLRTPVIGG